MEVPVPIKRKSFPGMDVVPVFMGSPEVREHFKAEVIRWLSLWRFCAHGFSWGSRTSLG
jgi:hypothetical protein